MNCGDVGSRVEGKHCLKYLSVFGAESAAKLCIRWIDCSRFHGRSDDPVLGDDYGHVEQDSLGAGLAGCVSRTK